MAGIHRRPWPLRHSLWLRSPGGLAALAACLVIGAQAGPARAESGPAPDAGSPTQTAEQEEGALTVGELTTLCRQLRSEDLETRRTAAEQIVALGPSSIPTIRHRLRRDLRAAPQDLQELLDRVAPDVRGRRLPPRRGDPPFDILPPLLEAPRDDRMARLTANDATEVTTLLRALTTMATSPAVRVLVQFGARERGVFRAEVARNMRRLGDRALPALIITTQHADERVAQQAVDMLEFLGRTTPGRQVQVRDPGTLAEILTVYGDLSDRSTIPVLLTFTGSEAAAVRDAARTSLLRYGSAILWPTRTKYENFTGEEPRRRWNWRDLAQRLFEAQDEARMAQAETAMEQGLQMAERRDFEAMATRYEEILARWPDYDRRAEMIPGLVAFADALEAAGNRDRARHVIAQAALLDPLPERTRPLRARLLLHATERGLERGVADVAPLERIAEMSEDHRPRAAALRAEIQDRTEAQGPYFFRIIAAIGLGLSALACLGFLAMRVFSAAGKPQETARDREEEAPDADQAADKPAEAPDDVADEADETADEAEAPNVSKKS